MKSLHRLFDLLTAQCKSSEKITLKKETTKTEIVDSENEKRWWFPELYEDFEDETLITEEHLNDEIELEQNKQPQMITEELIKFIAKGPPVFDTPQKRIMR